MEIPLIAYGTWLDNYNDAPIITDRVKNAIELGYTHIDTARGYGTESYAIQGIIDSGIPRDAIYLTSKVKSIIDPDILKKDLGDMNYYDLLLLHYPPLGTRSRNSFKRAISKIWGQMQLYIFDGVTRAIGVSNFYQNHLEVLLEVCTENNFIFPAVNQIEIHLGNLELNYVPFMQDNGIIPFAHTPLGGLGSYYLLNNEVLINISTRISSENISVSPANIILAYLLKRGIGVVTSSKNYQHMEESIRVMDTIPYLTEEDMQTINSTESGFGPMVEGSIISWQDNMDLY
jgi:diketogulonate reductase-like aldo/keto reductase